MTIYPAIDLLGGKCVRLRRGDYADSTEYSNDPVSIAQGFQDEGAEWLHVVDLDGAKSGEPQHLETIRRICTQTSLRVQLGGGLRTDESIDRALEAGVQRAVLGTRLVGNFLHAQGIFERYGDKVAVGLDLRDGCVAIHGWTETAGLAGIDFAKTLFEIGACRFIVTDVATDGMLEGPNIELLEVFIKTLETPIIASGGISGLADLDRVRALGVEGVIVGKALYEGNFTLAAALSQDGV